MILAHKIALDPTMDQKMALARAAGCARFIWNWALAEWDRQYKAGEKPTAAKLKLKWNQIKKTEFPWIYESPKDSNQQPFANLNKAFSRFFKKKSKYPKFKRKGVHDSFYISNNLLSFRGFKIRLPIIGWVNTLEELRFIGKIMSATVSKTADRWFISISVEMPEYKKDRISSNSVGIDLGVNTALMLSDGEALEAPKPLKAGLKKLRRPRIFWNPGRYILEPYPGYSNKAHSRKQKGSSNRKKSQIQLARHHSRIRSIRQDWTHKITTKIVRENQTIVLEDLNVSGMLKQLGRSVSDIGFYEIRRQIEYKAQIYGNQVVFVDRFFPSSKLCSSCGTKKDRLSRSSRIFECIECGLKIDRDLNAAKNILAAGLAVTACGPESSGFERSTLGTKLSRDKAGTRNGGCYV